jgi:hypothetical protein
LGASQRASIGRFCNDRRRCGRSRGALLLVHVALKIDLLAALAGDVDLEGVIEVNEIVIFPMATPALNRRATARGSALSGEQVCHY